MKGRMAKDSGKGQSVVEMAFALPILLLLVVGIIELGFALNAYVQTINAVREGARFGSMGGSDTGITTVVQGATSYLTQYDDSNSDLYVVRTDVTGTAPVCVVDPSTFQCEQTLDTPALDTACITVDELNSRLASSGMPTCQSRLVAVDLQYRSPSFLELPLVKQFSEAIPMRSVTVMRMESPRPLSGVCNAYPIAVHRSVLAGKGKGAKINDILNGTGEGEFGWLRWPNDPSGGSAGALEDALTRPTTDEFENAMDPDDTHLSVGDWVWANTGLSNSSGARNALDNLKNKGWIRIVVFDQHTYDQGGANGMFHATNFAIVKLTDYHLPGKNSISIEFVGMDSTGCIE